MAAVAEPEGVLHAWFACPLSRTAVRAHGIFRISEGLAPGCDSARVVSPYSVQHD